MSRRRQASRAGRCVAPLAGVLLIVAPGCSGYRRTLEPQPTPAPASEHETAPTPPEGAPEAAPVESPVPEPSKPTAGLSAAFPGVRIDADRKLVEFDARVSPLIFAPYEGRFFYLEQFVCKAGTKDHESLVVTDVAPSQIHAALLLIGLQPGHPVTWDHSEGRPVARAAEGPEVEVRFVLGEGAEARVVDPRDWTKAKDGTQRFPQGHWVFAGSAIAGTEDAPFYEADAAGTIVGLASFGTEVIAWPKPISHEEADEQLEWVADLEATPPADAPVVVRITPIGR